MKLTDVLQAIQNSNVTEELTKKRFACANCGITWIEIVGLVIGHTKGKEDICLRIGMESEACQVCRMNARQCQKCASKDVYELRFEEELSETPLNFKSIRTVKRSTVLRNYDAQVEKMELKNKC